MHLNPHPLLPPSPLFSGRPTSVSSASAACSGSACRARGVAGHHRFQQADVGVLCLASTESGRGRQLAGLTYLNAIRGAHWHTALFAPPA